MKCDKFCCGMNVKRRLYEAVVVSIAQHQAETWIKGAAE